MISRGIEAYEFTKICLILETKFRDDPQWLQRSLFMKGEKMELLFIENLLFSHFFEDSISLKIFWSMLNHTVHSHET